MTRGLQAQGICLNENLVLIRNMVHDGLTQSDMVEIIYRIFNVQVTPRHLRSFISEHNLKKNDQIPYNDVLHMVTQISNNLIQINEDKFGNKFLHI